MGLKVVQASAAGSSVSDPDETIDAPQDGSADSLPASPPKTVALARSAPALFVDSAVGGSLAGSLAGSKSISEASPDAAPFASPVLSREEKIAQLAQMDDSEVKPCQKCRLCATRTKTVFGEGDPDAKIFFIGEGPGENEDLTGRPFIGRAGELLGKMIAGMGLSRERVFIANIVKCRPPENRVPAPDEVATCTPYLVRQLEIVRPQVIVTLGLPAAKYMLSTKVTMGSLRGNWQSWRGIKLMPTFHPAYLLRSYTEANRAMVWSDLKAVMAAVGLSLPAKSNTSSK
jgi:DNA polymerase